MPLGRRALGPGAAACTSTGAWVLGSKGLCLHRLGMTRTVASPQPKDTSPCPAGCKPTRLGPARPRLPPPQTGAVGWLLGGANSSSSQPPISTPHSVSNMTVKEKLPKHLFQVTYLTFSIQRRASPHHIPQLLLDIPSSEGLPPHSCWE